MTRIPDVKEFQIKLSDTDRIYAMLGIVKRGEVEMQFKPLGNKRMNRYLGYTVRRLNRYRSDPSKY